MRLAGVDRRLAAVAVVLVPLAISSAMARHRAGPAWARDSIPKALAIAAAAPEIRDSLAVRQQTLRTTGLAGFAGGDNAAMAAFAAYVARVTNASAVELRGLRVSADSAGASGIRRLRLDATAAGDIRGLVQVVRVLESGDRLVRIRSISVAQPNVAAAGGEPETLNIQLSIEALSIRRIDASPN